MACESNGNQVNPSLLSVAQRTHGSSNEDLSEYTDADESISAPTEFLSEFLSALMLKDYCKALKYCELILHYEPNNVTAKEFYPFILEKLNKLTPSEDDLSTSSNSDDADPITSPSESQIDSDCESSDVDKENEQISLEPESSGDLLGLEDIIEKSASPRIDSDGTTNSYSSLEDEEAIIARDDSSSLEEVVVHQPTTTDNDDNGNAIFAGEFDPPPPPRDNSNFNWFTKRKDKNRNSVPDAATTTFQMSSDSESPTDPVTQQTVEMLRLKFVNATT